MAIKITCLDSPRTTVIFVTWSKSEFSVRDLVTKWKYNIVSKELLLQTVYQFQGFLYFVIKKILNWTSKTFYSRTR